VDNYKRGLQCLVQSVLNTVTGERYAPQPHGHAYEFLAGILPAVFNAGLYDLAGTLLALAPPQILTHLARTLRRGTSRPQGLDHIRQVQQTLDRARPLARLAEVAEE